MNNWDRIAILNGFSGLYCIESQPILSTINMLIMLGCLLYNTVRKN